MVMRFNGLLHSRLYIPLITSPDVVTFKAIIVNPVEDHLLVLLDPRILVRCRHSSFSRNNVRKERFFCCAAAHRSLHSMNLMNLHHLLIFYCTILPTAFSCVSNCPVNL